MSETKGPGDAEWLARRLAAHLSSGLSDDLPPGGPHDEPDLGWVPLLGVAAMPIDEAELRIEDVTALVVRLLDYAVDEWFALEQSGESRAGEGNDIDDPDDRCEAEATLDQDIAGPTVRFADDRTRDEALWSVLIDQWRRVAPPFATVVH